MVVSVEGSSSGGTEWWGSGGLDVAAVMCRLCQGLLHQPRVLPCLHSFCTSCLQTHLSCPLCQVAVPLSILPTLPLDYPAIALIRSFPGRHPCFSCNNQEIMAVAKCITCSSALCSTCLQDHKLSDCHEWSQIDKNSNKAITEPTCLSHSNEALTHFCIECNIPVCDLCLKADHQGDSHECQPVSKCGEKMFTILSKTINDNQESMMELFNTTHFSEQALARLHNQHRDSKIKINKTYEEFKILLERQRDDQLNNLDMTYHDIKRKISEINKISKESCEKLSTIYDFFSKLLNYGTLLDSLVFKSIIEERSKEVTSNAPEKVTAKLQFYSNPKTIYDSVSNAFGYLSAQLEVNGISQLPLCSVPSKQWENVSRLAEQILNMGLSECRISSSSLLDSTITKVSSRPSSQLSLISQPFYDSLTPPKVNHPLKSIIPRQQISFTWKFGALGKLEGQFLEPNGVAWSTSDDIVIADTNNNRVQFFNKVGKFKFHFGCLPKCDGQLLFPNRVAVTPNGDIVVTERAPTHQVQIYNQYGQFVRKFGSDILQFPRAVTVDKNDNIIIVECKIMRIIIFDQYGKLINKFNCHDTLQFPNGVAVYNNEIFVSDNRSHCVMVYDYYGRLLRVIGCEGLTNYPIGVVVSKDGHVLVADNHNNFNLTAFKTDGELIGAFESKVKHSQCYDVAISVSGEVALTCKDCHVYLYRYPMQLFPSY